MQENPDLISPLKKPPAENFLLYATKFSQVMYTEKLRFARR